MQFFMQKYDKWLLLHKQKTGPRAGLSGVGKNQEGLF